MNKKRFINKLSERLGFIHAEIEMLEHKLPFASENLQKRYVQRIVVLRGKKESLRHKITTLSDRHQEAWETMYSGIGTIMNDMKFAFMVGLSRFC